LGGRKGKKGDMKERSRRGESEKRKEERGRREEGGEL